MSTQNIKNIESELNDRELQIYRVYLEHDKGDGLTSDEVEIKLGLPHQQVSTRISALVRRTLLEDKGVRRKSRAGRSVIVYTLKRP